MNQNDKLPPQNLEAEKSVIGSILIDKESIEKVIDILRPEDFYSRQNQLIYGAMVNLLEKNEPIDILTVTNKLEEIGELESSGGAGYLTSLLSITPTSAHILNYGKIVQRKKILRDLIDSAHKIVSLGHQEEESIEKILDQAEQGIFAVSQRSISKDFKALKEGLQEAFERLERLHKGDGALRGFSTGFVDLDNILAGLQRSDLIILGARPSFGKTSLALDIARNVARKENVGVGIFSLEMSKDQVIDRILASEAGIGLWKMRTGHLSSSGDFNDFSKISIALNSLSQVPIFIDDTPSPTVLQIRAMARRLRSKSNLGLLVIDYLQLVQPRNDIDGYVQQVTDVANSLKGLARELNIPVIAVSQLSRAVEARPDQRPRLSDLRESGGIEQAADLVMFIHREDKVKRDSDKKNIAELIIAKHRNGPTGAIELYFDEDEVSFKNLAKNI
ncbi:MAG: replicative DNA helicase [Parcubacteria group bacterium RIFCSPLOWO2_01_FULL_40_65]|nr:MAG: replicative DNA helicase [Parcubacteria group bacterium RIFCSPHIGHO2_01_FULL_40_30]OHB19717.1 MAG: replicative DNA helicase [Parcubacteria group bacterium RIFCSPHIGHO2_02_FULL_40_12]OHB21854.1 MAG: replicative DNA helicase [Parcubacteria group bacterium RIFCSPLOWO2_01_FULL_40_65]OHB23616.1 MAG: replicative DNA helicase [Parcubacteria group bacterium RIFCSPLOWO2_02_FULL_40_12]